MGPATQYKNSYDVNLRGKLPKYRPDEGIMEVIEDLKNNVFALKIE
jgi:hypothetical protein